MTTTMSFPKLVSIVWLREAFGERFRPVEWNYTIGSQ